MEITNSHNGNVSTVLGAHLRRHTYSHAVSHPALSSIRQSASHRSLIFCSLHFRLTYRSTQITRNHGVEVSKNLVS